MIMTEASNTKMRDCLPNSDSGGGITAARDGSFPKISIVTPSLNQGEYIEATIESVIGQNYPNLEYIVVDGGSQDKTVDIIKKYERFISYWESKKDNGQASAINRGFAIASGDILAWLNSDDMYLPGALHRVAAILSEGQVQSDRIIVFGNCLHLYQNQFAARGRNVKYTHQVSNIELCDYIIQPSSFWTRAAFEATGALREDLSWSFDWEWFIRAKKRSVLFHPVDDFLSVYRIHSEHKSESGGYERMHELARIYREYHPKKIARAYVKMNTCRSMLNKSKVLKQTKIPGIMAFLMGICCMCVYRITWRQVKALWRM
jgi:glycosyltransferase involved in cell wall biosynthesis